MFMDYNCHQLKLANKVVKVKKIQDTCSFMILCLRHPESFGRKQVTKGKDQSQGEEIREIKATPWDSMAVLTHRINPSKHWFSSWVMPYWCRIPFTVNKAWASAFRYRW